MGTKDRRGPFAVMFRDSESAPWTLDHTYNDARDAANGRAWHERQSGRMCRIVPLGAVADRIEEQDVYCKACDGEPGYINHACGRKS